MKKLLALVLALMMFLTAMPVVAEDAPLYTEENILIDAGDHQIPATVTLPVVAEGVKVPAVVMLHGNGSTRHEAGNAYDFTAPEMAKAGIATIRFDCIGNGDSTSDYIDFTYDKAVADAMKCYEYLGTLGCIDMDKVGIMGWSMGGFITLLTAARNDVFASVMTWAGAFYMGNTESLQEQYAIAKENGYYEVKYDWRDSLKQSPEYYECLMAIDSAAEVANIKAPILAVAGSEDVVVPPSVAEQIIAASTSKGSFSKVLNGADHTFCVFTGDNTALQNVTNETIQWFTNTLVYDIIDQDMTYSSRGCDIQATLVTPENAENYPLVVLVHGHGGSRDECFGYIDIANEQAKKDGYVEVTTFWGDKQQLSAQFFEDLMATDWDTIKDAAMAEFYGAEITDASGNNHSYSFYSTEYPELRATIVNASAAFFAENLK